MEERTADVGIKIYTPNTPRGATTSNAENPPNPDSTTAEEGGGGGGGGGKKRKAMAKGVQKTLTKTSMLVNFLPTGTLLTFEMLLPSAYGDGRECLPMNRLMIHTLLGLCSLSCFFFHFTDSFKSPVDGKVYYGFVTTRGLSLFKTGLGVEVPKDERYIVRFSDFVHAVMSVMVFAAIALSDYRVTYCLFPGHVKEMDQVMESFPLMVGVVCSGLFLVFPNTRYGVGCMSPT